MAKYCIEYVIVTAVRHEFTFSHTRCTNYYIYNIYLITLYYIKFWYCKKAKIYCS